MPMLQQPTLPEGYATIRRSKGRVEHKLRASSTPSIEMMELSPRRKSLKRNFESEVRYANRSVVFDESCEVDEGVLNDIESDVDGLGRFDDEASKRTTFETFKPRNSIESGDDGSDKDLGQSSECFQSLPYDIIMSPLKSPQYINQLNAMRSKTDSSRQFPLYARPESPKYGKLLYNRSTSPSADSMDNSSSNSSTYSSNHNHHAVFQQASMMTQSLHIPSTHQHQSDDDNVILINVQPNIGRHPPLKATSLNYRKSFSHVNGNGKWFNANDSLERINRAGAIDSSSTMTKSLYDPSISTSHLQTRRFATLAHPRPMFEHENKSTSSSSLIQWNPILSCKIGSQTTLRTKPPVPWYELAIKKEFRQSCPPLQVNIQFFNNVRISRDQSRIHNQFRDIFFIFSYSCHIACRGIIICMITIDRWRRRKCSRSETLDWRNMIMNQTWFKKKRTKPCVVNVFSLFFYFSLNSWEHESR